MVCRRIPRFVLEAYYGIILPEPKPHEDPNRDELLASYAYVRGFTTSRGEPDRHRAARIILKDFMRVYMQ